MYFSTSSVKIGGSEYKPTMILAVTFSKDFEPPNFGQVKDIFLIDGKAYFHICALDTIEYSEHYCAFITQLSSRNTLISHAELGSYLPLASHTLASYPGCLCIVPKSIIR